MTVEGVNTVLETHCSQQVESRGSRHRVERKAAASDFEVPPSRQPVQSIHINNKRIAANKYALWFPPAITQPISEGVNSMTVCHPIVMMFAFPFHHDDTSTMGPGSRYRRT